MKLRLDASGVGCETPLTVHELFLQAVGQYGDLFALASKKQGRWTRLTFRKYYEECRVAAKSFLKVRGSWGSSLEGPKIRAPPPNHTPRGAAELRTWLGGRNPGGGNPAEAVGWGS